MRPKAAHLCLAFASAMIPITAHAVQIKTHIATPQVKLGNPASGSGAGRINTGNSASGSGAGKTNTQNTATGSGAGK
jgi:hypothetical protein